MSIRFTAAVCLSFPPNKCDLNIWAVCLLLQIVRFWRIMENNLENVRSNYLQVILRIVRKASCRFEENLLATKYRISVTRRNYSDEERKVWRIEILENAWIRGHRLRENNKRLVVSRRILVLVYREFSTKLPPGHPAERGTLKTGLKITPALPTGDEQEWTYPFLS